MLFKFQKAVKISESEKKENKKKENYAIFLFDSEMKKKKKIFEAQSKTYMIQVVHL